MKNELTKIATRLNSLSEALDEHEAKSVEDYADLLLTNHISRKVAERLEEKRKEGRHGWWEPVVISTGDLRILKEQSAYSDIDKFIFSAMIEIREEMDRGHN